MPSVAGYALPDAVPRGSALVLSFGLGFDDTLLLALQHQIALKLRDGS